LAVLIWQPMLRSHRVETTPSVVGVVIDESRSMGIRDRWQNRKRRADLLRALGDPKLADATRSEILERLLNKQDAVLLRGLAAKNQLRLYRFGSDVRGAELRISGAGQGAAAKPSAGTGEA